MSIVWDILKTRLRKLEHPPQTFIDLRRTVALLWEELPQDAIQETTFRKH